MNVLVLHATKNTGGKRDATGAFMPESGRFAEQLKRLHPDAHVVRVGFDNTLLPRHRRAQVEKVIALGPAGDGAGHWDRVALFCHGTHRGLQTGHTLATLPRLVAALAPRLRGPNHAIITLYACSTADGKDTKAKGPGGDGGFADRLRDKLSVLGFLGHVDAHSTVGHTTINPFVRRFYLDGQAEGYGGDWIVAPGSPEWRTWVRRLADKNDTLRFDFPSMTLPEVDSALARG